MTVLSPLSSVRPQIPIGVQLGGWEMILRDSVLCPLDSLDKVGLKAAGNVSALFLTGS